MKHSNDLKLIKLKNEDGSEYPYLIPNTVAEYIVSLEEQLDKEPSHITKNQPYRQD